MLAGSAYALADALAERGLVDPAEFVDGGVVIRQRHGRVGGVAVIRRGGTSWFLKRAAAPDADALAHERRVLVAMDAGDALRSLAPMLRRSAEGELVTELLPGRTMGDLALRQGGTPPPLAAQVGQALQTLHSGGRAVAAVVPDAIVQWALRPHRPRLRDLEWLSAGSCQLLRALQGRPEICRRLDTIRDRWRKETLIHGDLRWSNVIVAPPLEPDGFEVRLVDWEAGGRGDPAWDVGTVLAEFLAEWLHSMPAEADPRPDALVAAARRDLDQVHQASTEFWSAYSEGTEVGQAGELLTRATDLAGVRMVQLAVEIAQSGPWLSRMAVAHMQVGANVINDPVSGARELLGLAPSA